MTETLAVIEIVRNIVNRGDQNRHAARRHRASAEAPDVQASHDRSEQGVIGSWVGVVLRAAPQTAGAQSAGRNAGNHAGREHVPDSCER